MVSTKLSSHVILIYKPLIQSSPVIPCPSGQFSNEPAGPGHFLDLDRAKEQTFKSNAGHMSVLRSFGESNINHVSQVHEIWRLVDKASAAIFSWIESDVHHG